MNKKMMLNARMFLTLTVGVIACCMEGSQYDLIGVWPAAAWVVVTFWFTMDEHQNLLWQHEHLRLKEEREEANEHSN